MRHARKLLMIAAGSFCCLAFAQDAAPATSPAATTAPTTRPRHVLSIPPGFEQIQCEGRKILCEPADKPWIEQATRSLKPTTRPTTMPADLIGRLENQKDGLARRIAGDYRLDEAAPIAKRLDQLLVELKRLRDFSPPLFFLVTTQARLKELTKTGQWSDPGVHYNRLADDVMFRRSVPLNLDQEMDDTVLTCLYAPADTPAQRQQKLQDLLSATQVRLEEMLSGQGQYVTQMVIVQAIQDEVFGPMKLPIEQGWLATGLSGATSAEYAAQLIGSPRQELLLLIAAELRTNPIKMQTINLLHPVEPSSLRRQYVAAYIDAYRRKCMNVALVLIEKTPDKVPLLVKSMREKPCASGEDLVKRIKEVTGIDVTPNVSAE